MENEYFIITVFRKKTKQVEISHEMIVNFTKEMNKISSGDYATRFNVTPKTASRHLNKLVVDGALVREGEKKGTKYFLKEK